MDLHKKSFFILVCVLFVLQGCVLSRKTIVGSVIGADGKVVKQASITTEPPTEAVFTDSLGRFIIRGVSVGKYSVRATKSGYAENGVNVNVAGEGVVQADIQIDSETESPTINLPPE